MNIFHVIIDKPSKIADWDIWTGESFFRPLQQTEAYITAKDEKHLAQKMENLYKGFSFVVKSHTGSLK